MLNSQNPTQPEYNEVQVIHYPVDVEKLKDVVQTEDIRWLIAHSMGSGMTKTKALEVGILSEGEFKIRFESIVH